MGGHDFADVGRKSGRLAGPVGRGGTVPGGPFELRVAEQALEGVDRFVGPFQPLLVQSRQLTQADPPLDAGGQPLSGAAGPLLEHVGEILPAAFVAVDLLDPLQGQGIVGLEARISR